MTAKITLPQEDDRTIRWIAMSLSPGFGAQKFEKWRTFNQDPPPPEMPLATLAAEIVADCHRRGIRVITWDDADYPTLLRGSRAAQPVLYMRGGWGPARAVAMVGTRAASWNGKAAAKALVQALQGIEVCIVSGLAEGIDLSSHKAALECNIHTIAVIAQGLDQRIAGERGLVAKKILESGGGLVSPFPPGTAAFKGNFLARNGIIAGLCEATVVVECREQSGALNTADHCIADQRRLLAIPGDILRGSAQGPNMLIESGEATAIWLPVQLPILCQLDVLPDAHTTQKEYGIFTALRGECLTLNEIIDRTGKSTQAILEALSLAEIHGIVQQHHDGRYSFS